MVYLKLIVAPMIIFLWQVEKSVSNWNQIDEFSSFQTQTYCWLIPVLVRAPYNFIFFHHLPANPGQTMRCWCLLRSSPLGTSVPAWLQLTILVAAFNPLCPWVTFFLMETWSTCMSLEPSDLDALCGLHQCWFLCWKSQGATAANGPDNNRKTITAPGLPRHNP